MNTIRLTGKKVPLIAHRGASGLEKENTCAAFVAAGNRGYFGIETDVHVTRDGCLVLIHDEHTARVAVDDLVVENSTYDTLRGLLLTDRDGRKGRSDLRIPNLLEYVRICKKYEKTGVLELKNPFEKERIEQVLDVIKGEDYLDHIIFISFYPENLVELRRILPEQPCQFLTDRCDEEVLDFLRKNRMDLDVYYPPLTKEYIASCHESGIRVNCWTVDDPAEAEKLIGWGVDFITTNILE